MTDDLTPRIVFGLPLLRMPDPETILAELHDETQRRITAENSASAIPALHRTITRLREQNDRLTQRITRAHRWVVPNWQAPTKHKDSSDG